MLPSPEIGRLSIVVCEIQAFFRAGRTSPRDVLSRKFLPRFFRPTLFDDFGAEREICATSGASEGKRVVKKSDLLRSASQKERRNDSTVALPRVELMENPICAKVLIPRSWSTVLHLSRLL